jgi:hypothetical protein
MQSLPELQFERERTKGPIMDVEKLTELLREAEEHHGSYEASAPKHHWSGFYAAYIVAREEGQSAEEADQDARRHMDGVVGKE